MASPAFLWNDLVAAATLSVPGGATPPATLPLANMQDPQLRLRTRFEADSAIIQADFGAAQDIAAVGILGTNLSVATAVRWRIGNDATMAATNYDDTVATTPTAAGNGNIILLHATSASGRYLRLDIAAPGVTMIDIGRLVAGDLFRPQGSQSLGWTEGRAVLDRRERNPLTGAEFPVPALRNPRVTSFTFGTFRASEATGALRSMVDQLGAVGDVLWIPDTADTQAELNRRAVWGAVVRPGNAFAPQRASHLLWSLGFSIEERL